MAEWYLLPCCVGLRVYTHKQYGLASVRKSIFVILELGLNSFSSRHGKMRCRLLCCVCYPLADAKCLRARPQQAQGNVFSQPACRGVSSGQTEELLALELLRREVFFISALWHERLPILIDSGAG